MGESSWHARALAALLHGLSAWFSRREDVFVGANQFIYYEEGNPARNICPDVYVAFGVPKHERRVWKTWEEGLFPQVIFELSSSNTYEIDAADKKGRYEFLGVQEYFLFDPEGQIADPRLQGFRRRDRLLLPVPEELSTGGVRLRSEKLTLLLEVEDTYLRLIDAESGQRLPFPHEEAEARQRESEARQQAEAEVQQLLAQIERLKRGD